MLVQFFKFYRKNQISFRIAFAHEIIALEEMNEISR